MHTTSLYAILRRPWAVCLALWLACVMALAPTVSHALVHARPDLPIEICSSSGTRTVPADAPVSQGAPLALDHCPFCLHPSDRSAPPPSQTFYLFSVTGGQQEAAVAQAFFYAHPPAFAPPPRGPPHSV